MKKSMIFNQVHSAISVGLSEKKVKLVFWYPLHMFVPLIYSMYLPYMFIWCCCQHRKL